MLNREKIAVSVGGVLLSILFFYLLLIAPAKKRIKRLEKMIAKEEIELPKLIALKDEYLSLKGITGKASSRETSTTSGEFSLLSYLETTAQSVGIRDSISSINPQGIRGSGEYKGNAVEINIQDIKISKIVKYLYRLENSNHSLSISRLTLKNRFDNPDKFDAKFTIISFSKT